MIINCYFNGNPNLNNKARNRYLLNKKNYALGNVSKVKKQKIAIIIPEEISGKGILRDQSSQEDDNGIYYDDEY